MTDATVLLVDDERALVRLYERFLSDEYEVVTATSGSEALSAATDEVDVAVLDRRMPGMTGGELLAELRAAGLDCQVAMLTAVEPDADVVEMPFQDYRVKPVDEAELRGLVEVLLERATYDEYSQEFFSLASKKAALEIAGNDAGGEYDELCAEMATVRERLDESLDHVGARAAFSDLRSVSD